MGSLQRDSLMYEEREDLVTHLRVHSIPGVMDFILFQVSSYFAVFCFVMLCKALLSYEVL